MAQSEGHIAFIGEFEYFRGDNGDIARARTFYPIQTDGRRAGRFVTTEANWDAYRKILGA